VGQRKSVLLGNRRAGIPRLVSWQRSYKQNRKRLALLGCWIGAFGIGAFGPLALFEVRAWGAPRPPRGARRGVERALGTRLDASQQPASVCSRKRYPGTRSGQTRLPYGIALHERRWHGGLRRPRSSLGGQRSPSRPFVSAAINSRGRPRPGGRERRAVAKRVCGRGSGTKRCPRLRNNRCRARIESPSRRRVRLDTAPGRVTCRCNRSRSPRARPAIAAADAAGFRALLLLRDASPVSFDAPTPASCFARQRHLG
jgi:hypothetical protein